MRSVPFMVYTQPRFEEVTAIALSRIARASCAKVSEADKYRHARERE
jgi:hypothetical protein